MAGGAKGNDGGRDESGSVEGARKAEGIIASEGCVVANCGGAAELMV